jgi:hypothetical protein
VTTGEHIDGLFSIDRDVDGYRDTLISECLTDHQIIASLVFDHK